MRGAALGDDVVGGGAVGALVVGVWRIVDGAFGVSRSLLCPMLPPDLESQVLSARIWAKWESGGLNEAAALGVVMVLVMSAIILVAQHLTGQKIAQTQQHTRI